MLFQLNQSGLRFCGHFKIKLTDFVWLVYVTITFCYLAMTMRAAELTNVGLNQTNPAARSLFTSIYILIRIHFLEEFVSHLFSINYFCYLLATQTSVICQIKLITFYG